MIFDPFLTLGYVEMIKVFLHPIMQSPTVPPCPCLHGRPTVGPSCTEFVYPECWHFDNGAISKFDDVLLEHGGLPHVLSLAVQLKFVWLDK